MPFCAVGASRRGTLPRTARTLRSVWSASKRDTSLPLVPTIRVCSTRTQQEDAKKNNGRVEDDRGKQRAQHGSRREESSLPEHVHHHRIDVPVNALVVRQTHVIQRRRRETMAIVRSTALLGMQ